MADNGASDGRSRGTAKALDYTIRRWPTLVRYADSGSFLIDNNPVLASDMPVADPVVQWVARQVRSDAATSQQYGTRDEARREHFQKLRAYLTLSTFGLRDFRTLVHSLADLAMQTDKGIVLASQSLETLR